MARIVSDEIKFDSLSKELQRALNLLLKHKEKALRYWTRKGSYWSCPLQEAYGLELTLSTWRQIRDGEEGYPYESPDIPPNPKAIKKLLKLGWTPRTYNTFMKWFDARNLSMAGRDRRHNFLKNFLSN